MKRLWRAWNKRPLVEGIGTWMVCFLFVISATMFSPRTAEGVQCPTAEVQQVQAAELRAPAPGDPEFVQCFCAERKAAESGSGMAVGGLPTFILPPALVVPPMLLIATMGRADSPKELMPPRPPSSPEVPPPLFV